MFSGIIENSYSVISFDEADKLAKLKIEVNSLFVDGISLGASVAVNGVCLTVSRFGMHLDKDFVEFDVMLPSLNKTNLGLVSAGTKVNLERSLMEGSENGGHQVSGHVDSTATVTKAIRHDSGNFELQLKLDSALMKYVFIHGFLSINGASLTVAEIDKARLRVDIWLVPETLERTNLSEVIVGSVLNIEINRATQVIVDTISDVTRQVLAERLDSGLDSADLDLSKVSELINGDYLSESC